MAKKLYTVNFKESFVSSWDEAERTFLEHCARFNVPRQTGYDWLSRVTEGGLEALELRSCAPLSCPHATNDEVVQAILAARRLHPTWGPRKLAPWMLRRNPKLKLPAASTMGDILKRAGLVPKQRRRRRTPLHPQPFAAALAPNDVWTADFKGQFRLGDRSLCYPLTIADSLSRYLLCCDGFLTPDGASARASFEATFREFGLPLVIHTDNGTPFASTAPAGLSKLSAWWVRLGIRLERSAPASPWQNGQHERMHRTLKEEATHPPRRNLALQQRAFNTFQREFNEERPHEALGQRPPATAYKAGSRPYPRRLPELEYPDDYELRRVDNAGHFKWKGRQMFASQALAGEYIGLKQTADFQHDVFFGPLLLGYLDDRHLKNGLVRYKR